MAYWAFGAVPRELLICQQSYDRRVRSGDGWSLERVTAWQTYERPLHRGLDGALYSGGPYGCGVIHNLNWVNSMAGTGGAPTSLVVDNGHGRPVTTGNAWNEQWGPQLKILNICMNTIKNGTNEYI